MATLSALQRFGFSGSSCEGNLLTRVGWVHQAQIVTWHPELGICKKRKLYSNPRYDPAWSNFMLLHFWPMFPFCTHWKHEKTLAKYVLVRCLLLRCLKFLLYGSSLNFTSNITWMRVNYLITISHEIVRKP